MNEILNNPMVIDIINKIGITLDVGVSEYVRYIMVYGLLRAIAGGVILAISVRAFMWLCKMAYETRSSRIEPPYSLFGIGVFTIVVFPSIIVTVSGLVDYLCPIGSMINGVLK